jgi:hypothetical protein
MGRKPKLKTLRERARNMTVADLAKLNDRMIAFANAYLENGGNASEAARAAGYAAGSANVQGNRLKKNPVIASYIADLQGRVGAIAGLDRAFLLASLRKEYEGASGGDLVRGFDGQPVVVSSDTPGAVAFALPDGSTVYHLRRPDRTAALRSLELIGRTLGLLSSAPGAGAGDGAAGKKGAPVEGSDIGAEGFTRLLEAARAKQGGEEGQGQGQGKGQPGGNGRASTSTSRPAPDLATVTTRGEG